MEYANNQMAVQSDVLPHTAALMQSAEAVDEMGQNELHKADVQERQVGMQGMVQTAMLEEDEIDLGEYEIVRPEFFAHIKEPALTINVDKIGVNAACVRLMPDVEYVEILINRKEKKLLLLPCDEIELSGYRWGRTKNGKRYPSQRTGEPFVLTLCKIMDWNPDYRYKVLGKMVHAKGQSLIAFDLTSCECFPKTVNRDGKKISSRRAVFSEEWSGKFGPTYAESRRSLHIDTLDGYTVFSIKGKNVEIKNMAEAKTTIMGTGEQS